MNCTRQIDNNLSTHKSTVCITRFAKTHSTVIEICIMCKSYILQLNLECLRLRIHMYFIYAYVKPQLKRASFMYESIDDICDFEVRMHSCSTRGNKQGCIISGEERYMVVKVIEMVAAFTE